MLNEAGSRAIRDAIAYLKDNRYRYATFIRDPDWVSPNGERLADILAAHDHDIAALEENLHARV